MHERPRPRLRIAHRQVASAPTDPALRVLAGRPQAPAGSSCSANFRDGSVSSVRAAHVPVRAVTRTLRAAHTIPNMRPSIRSRDRRYSPLGAPSHRSPHANFFFAISHIPFPARCVWSDVLQSQGALRERPKNKERTRTERTRGITRALCAFHVRSVSVHASLRPIQSDPPFLMTWCVDMPSGTHRSSDGEGAVCHLTAWLVPLRAHEAALPEQTVDADLVALRPERQIDAKRQVGLAR